LRHGVILNIKEIKININSKSLFVELTVSVERAHTTIVKTPPSTRQTAGSDWFFEYYGRKCFKLTLFLLQRTLDSDWSVELQVYYTKAPGRVVEPAMIKLMKATCKCRRPSGRKFFFSTNTSVVIDLAFPFFLFRDWRKFEESVNRNLRPKKHTRHKGKGETSRQTDF
jgi:hypothetical protein